MTSIPESENDSLLGQSSFSKPPLKLLIPAAVISLLVVGAGTMLVLAQGGGGTGAGVQNASTANGSIETITIGPDDQYVFEPEQLSIEPGTTVKFVWKSDDHNIYVEDQPEEANWSGHEQLEQAGYSTTHTFTTNGTYEFSSQPYEAVGMTGEIHVGQSNSSKQPVAATKSANISIGAGDQFKFEPSTDEPFVIESGTTVTFNWESSEHNIHVEEQPKGANWSGHDDVEAEGHSVTHTFDTTGVYEIVCEPHQAVGATGTIVVVDGNTSG